ncbi:hypothetical protein ABL78_7996 [Leptomonas seymouri]|uniref:RING-type domain-containing protein n=1 Tax=Leptomonas seymouri TaxID=5684 RepID=A0A0N1PB49_LEPSE|nr:hypothetical protein ABL78_7996 [Leptomonas seymouri]|eukprot:KPI82983.1 hypothetical protein ABL78_7996 [Leptomonas seymouri]
MEFRLAAEGNTDGLRQWLRAHPERVNLPARGSNMTLLYTAISNANRTDLASLQAGDARYLNMVRMLCEEYRADASAPNGGNHNTALHLAASIGATDILRFLVEVAHTPVNCANVFGETALQVAERGGFSECADVLRQAAAATAATTTTSTPLLPSSSGVLGSDSSSRFHCVTVSDSDDDDAGGGRRPDEATGSPSNYPLRQPRNAGMPSPLPLAPKVWHANPQAGLGVLPDTQLPPHRDNVASRSRDGGASILGSSSGETRMPGPGLSVGATVEGPTAAALSQPVRPRRELDISTSRILANPDLQGFRSAYGDGFKFIQCSDHYEVRGTLPYTYRKAVYYTPVIISIYAPAKADNAAGAETKRGVADSGEGPGSASDPNSPHSAAGSQRGGLPVSSPGGHTNVHCRYRVCLNMQSLNGFAISRKAEYVDPISGAIIPAPGDDKYQTLCAYIRNVVVRSFESVPPLIVPTSSYAFPLQPNISSLGAADNADAYRHHHSHNAPPFMRCALPARTAVHIRSAAILRDLSKFGDGLGRYSPANHRIVVYVPVFSEQKAAVLAMPQERPYTTTVDPSFMPASLGGGANASKLASYPPASVARDTDGGDLKKGVTQQVAVEAVAELQVRVWMQFNPIAAAGAALTGTSVDGPEGGVYAYPPRVYLVDAAAHPPAALTGSATPKPNTLTGPCFASILRDPDTGEVNPEKIKLSQESWGANGSVYDILLELQRALRDAVESFAISYTGRQPASKPVQQANGTGGSYEQSRAAASPVHLEAAAAASPLETFFTSSTGQPQHFASGPSGSGVGPAAESAQPNQSSSGRCLYCFQLLHTRSLLQPCGHDGMCGLCVQRLQSHCREEVFACPVCRSSVSSVMEVLV